MPGGDGTGPMGAGPMTGRGAGYCAGYATPGFASGAPGRGFGGGGRGFGGGGRGRGRGRRNWFYATGVPGWQRAAWGWPSFGFGGGAGGPSAPSAPFGAPPAMPRDQELDLLRRQAEGFAGALDEIRRRIEEMEAQGAQK